MKSACGLLLCLLTLPLAAAPGAADIITPQAEQQAAADHLQKVTNGLRDRLQIIETVLISISAHNPLVMSVETLAGRSGPFVITADEKFIRALNDRELEAAIAHELGHVWIYTHAPYMQSERLANDIALRVTSRSVLEPVYEKVWQRIGMRGNFADLISADGPGHQH